MFADFFRSLAGGIAYLAGWLASPLGLALFVLAILLVVGFWKMFAGGDKPNSKP